MGTQSNEIASSCIVVTLAKQKCNAGAYNTYIFVRGRTQAALRGIAQQVATGELVILPDFFESSAELAFNVFLFGVEHRHFRVPVAFFGLRKPSRSDITHAICCVTCKVLMGLWQLNQVRFVLQKM